MSVFELLQSKRQTTRADDLTRYRSILASDPAAHVDELATLADRLGITDEQCRADAEAVREYRRSQTSAESVTPELLKRLRAENTATFNALNDLIQKHKAEMDVARFARDKSHARLHDALNKQADFERMKHAMRGSGRGWIAES